MHSLIKNLSSISNSTSTKTANNTMALTPIKETKIIREEDLKVKHQQRKEETSTLLLGTL
jgi:hypothetical protein